MNIVKSCQNINSTSVHISQAIFLLCLHTSFIFDILFLPRGLLDLGLCSSGWESSGRLLQSWRWIWRAWNTKQNTWHMAIREYVVLVLVCWCFYHSCVGGAMSCQNGPIASIMMYVESLMTQNESKNVFVFSFDWLICTDSHSGKNASHRRKRNHFLT